MKSYLRFLSRNKLYTAIEVVGSAAIIQKPLRKTMRYAMCSDAQRESL